MSSKKLLTLFLALFFAGLMFVGMIYIYVQPQLPDVSGLKDVKLQTPLRVYSQDGKIISQFGEKRRILLSIEDIPQQLIDAVLATEDARFYEHNGVDPIGLVRAAIVLITTGQKSQGASTITMQVARNFFLTREKTYIRKIKEIFVALHIEQQLPKDKILELYLNRSFFGNRAYGVGAAAQVYYGKKVSELTLPEIAMIAGLPQSPSAANPIRNAERALKRRNVVLLRMFDVGFITQEQYQKAINAKITASYHDTHVDFYAPYIAEMARNYLVEQFGQEAAYTGGYSVYTTIDSKMQRYAQEALLDNLYAYDERHGYRGPQENLWGSGSRWSDDKASEYLHRIPDEQDLIPVIVLSVANKAAQVITRRGTKIKVDWQGLKWARKFNSNSSQGPAPKSATSILKSGDLIWIRYVNKKWRLSQVPQASSAIVALDPYDGAIKALIGGYSFNQSQYNRVTQAKRQIGSNIKPFIYAAALEKDLTLASLINNAPINEWDKRQGVAWRPKNSPDIYTGPTRIHLGLAQSINIMAVRVMRHVGLDETINELVKFGFKRDELPRNESLALGSAAVTPLEVARAFAVFANTGYLIDPYFINHIVDSDGNNIMYSTPRIACDSCYKRLKKYENPKKIIVSVQGMCPLPRERLAIRVLDPKVSFLLNEAMMSVIWGGGDWKHGTGWNGTGWRASRTVKRKDIAGKSGTTNESRDAWFSGYNANLVTTVWVGFDDNQKKLGYTTYNPNQPKNASGAESGAKTAGPAWNQFMKKALNPYPQVIQQPPPGVISVRIDEETGELSRKTDHTSTFEYFIEGTEPTTYAPSTSEDGDSESSEEPSDDLFE